MSPTREPSPVCTITRMIPVCEPILTIDAQDFLARLHRRFEATRQALLEARRKRQHEYNKGMLPDFLEETRSVRESEWQVASIPPEIADRRVEITGPVDRKTVINALNSEARVYMADFEDSHAPTWQATLEGQVNLIDAISGEMQYTDPGGKIYQLHDRSTVMMIRPRGWHLHEKHFLVDGAPISASLFDFGLNYFHTAVSLRQNGRKSYFYLPKMEHYLESRLWNDVFCFAEETLGMEHGSIRATALIETLPAVFQMHEILYEARDYLTGLNCGRWDYIFSYIKTFSHHPDRILPDRASITMNTPFLENYTHLLIDTCHQRGAFAMGGMAAQIPVKGNADKNLLAMEKVRNDKLREVTAGHDGTWVAHPGLIKLAFEVFDEYMHEENQIDRPPTSMKISRDDLIQACEGPITMSGLKEDVEVSIIYIASWLAGKGCLPIHHVMEDAATAEICRSLVWQWRYHQVRTQNDEIITIDLIQSVIDDVLNELLHSDNQPMDTGFLRQAARLFSELVTSDDFPDFLTLVAYDFI